MRLSLLLTGLFLMLVAASAQAQQIQERKLLDRVTRPDTSLEYDLRNSNFSGGRKVEGKNARTKEFGGATAFRAKDFQARSFWGSKDARVADKKFNTKEGNTKGKFEIPNKDKKTDTRSAQVKDARESSKTMDTREYAEANRSSRGGLPGNQGRSQDRLNGEMSGRIPTGTTPVGWSGNMKQMTIDDIRELLNKNK